VLADGQDTGTAIITAKRGQHVLTEGHDAEARARGVYETTATQPPYSQIAPLTIGTR